MKLKLNQKEQEKETTNKNFKFNDISTNKMPAGWSKYGAPDEREINTLKEKLNDVENKLLTNRPVENPVNNTERDRILKIEEGMKNMFVSGNNAIGDLYSKFDQIGDFTNKSKFRNPVKEEEKQQTQQIYNIEKESPKGFDEAKSRQIFKTHYKEELSASKPKKTKEEIKIETAIYQKNYREKQKIKKASIIKDQEQRNNLNKDIICKSKIFQLNKNIKDEQKEKRSNLNSFMQSQFQVDRLSRKNDEDKTKFNQILNNIKTVKENEKKVIINLNEVKTKSKRTRKRNN